MNATWEISADKKRAKVAVNGEADALELEKIIGDLMVIRAGMLPTVPYAPPRPENEADQDVNVTLQPEPHVAIELRRRSGKIRLWLRNAGLGWMVYDLPVATACGMRDYLVLNTPEAGERASLLVQKVGDPDASQ